MWSKISLTAEGITPNSSSEPIIVCVFPDDVCPYAKIVPARRVHRRMGARRCGEQPKEGCVNVLNFDMFLCLWCCSMIQSSQQHNLPFIPSMVDSTICFATRWYTSSVLEPEPKTWSFCLKEEEEEEEWEKREKTQKRDRGWMDCYIYIIDTEE